MMKDVRIPKGLQTGRMRERNEMSAIIEQQK